MNTVRTSVSFEGRASSFTAQPQAPAWKSVVRCWSRLWHCRGSICGQALVRGANDDFRRWLLVVMAFCFSVVLRAEEAEYERDIKPVLKARCFACHGALKQESGLRLDAGELIRRGGDGGAVVAIGKPEASLLIERVAAAEASKRMPPEGEPLTPEQIDKLRQWIAEGAASPENEQPEADPREHWAFRVPQRPAVPNDRYPIDAFIDHELARKGLVPQPTAPKHVLLRRVSLDLIGLPPTREELHAFLADDSPDAYEKVVDRLLADPRHGERWGRHWMDVWRYSDWYGRRDVNDVRNSASQLFRWRDWIVRSLNSGKGYDRMVQEMLAADEICPEDYEAGVATGFLIRNYYSLNSNDWMRSAVEHTGKAFLGLTFNCAHCHDHKYDPIAHDDYFRMRAFFEPVFIRQDRVAGEAEPGIFQDYTYSGTRGVQRLGTVRVFDRTPDAPTWFYTGGDERNRVKERGSIPPDVPAFIKTASFRIEPVSLPPVAWYPGLRPEIQETFRAEARQAVATAEEALSSFTAQPQAPANSSAVKAVASGSAVSEENDELQQTEDAYAQALELAKSAGFPGALAGEQSLLLDASAGRSIVQHGLKELKSLDDGVTLEFRLLILNDAHINFQLVKDNQKGLTAGYVAWEQGRIRAYQPGMDGEVEVGKYDFAAGQNQFDVTLVLQPSADQGRLTIRSRSDNVVLVDQVPTKMSGWNPVGSDIQTFSFDARTGSVVVIDDVHVTAASGDGNQAERLYSADFESPVYMDQVSPDGVGGWTRSTFSVAPGFAIVSRTAGNKNLREALQKLQLTQRKFGGQKLRRQAAEAKLTAARAALASLESRIAAENASLTDQPQAPANAPTNNANAEALASGSAVNELARAASRSEREARLRQAESDMLTQDVALLDAEAKPAEDQERSKAIEVATAALAVARAELDKAQAALADEKLVETYAPLSQQFPRQSTGRRKALAEWIASRDNPLTARVAVNHIWTRHFHTPLVASMYDFGRNGDRPTHPELLDWLAVEFMDSGWNMKHLHRLIVTSAAYRRNSRTSLTATDSALPDPHSPLALDPDNRLLWRMNTWRMESEVVRDSLLYVAGRLDLTLGGVEIENKDALTTHRRTLYYSSFPEAGGKSALGELFDAPDPLDCYRRASSIMPQQALALTNSDMVQQSGAAIVRNWIESRKSSATGDDDSAAAAEEFIVAMFETILSRPPSDRELEVSEEILAQQQQLATDPNSPDALRQARESLARILLNHNDFLTVR